VLRSHASKGDTECSGPPPRRRSSAATSTSPPSPTATPTSLFADDATVEDEGTEYHGLPAIREWRASVPLVNYTITNIDQTPDALVVTTIISGDFPGSPVTDLKYRFEDHDNHHIRVLRIRP